VYLSSINLNMKMRSSLSKHSLYPSFFPSTLTLRLYPPSCHVLSFIYLPLLLRITFASSSFISFVFLLFFLFSLHFPSTLLFAAVTFLLYTLFSPLSPFSEFFLFSFLFLLHLFFRLHLLFSLLPLILPIPPFLLFFLLLLLLPYRSVLSSCFSTSYFFLLLLLPSPHFICLPPLLSYPSFSLILFTLIFPLPSFLPLLLLPLPSSSFFAFYSFLFLRILICPCLFRSL
jgi:hypothetical protein